MLCLSVCGLHGAESIILSAGGAETVILSVGGNESMMLSACAESMIVSAPPTASMILSARTAGYGLGFPTTFFLSTVLRALRDLMYRGENSPLPGLGATSQNILWSTTKVNEACAWPPYVT